MNAPAPAVKLPVGDLVNLLTVGLHHAAVYFREHPRVAESAAEFARRLEEGLVGTGRDAMFLGVVRGRLVFEGRPLLGPTLIAKRLIESARRFHCGGFLFRRGIGAVEACEFLRACVERGPAPAGIEEARRLVVSLGISHVLLSSSHGERGWLGGDVGEGGDAAPAGPPTDPEHDPVQGYQSLFGAVEASHAAAGREDALDVAAARAVVEGVVAAMDRDESALLGLSRYSDYDFYSVGHSVRVSLFALVAGRRLGFDDARLVDLGTAALLHDAGKGFVPQEVLLKNGPLDEGERRAMARHPTLGAQALLRSPGASPLAVAIAFGHHLRPDLAGYPALRPWGRAGRLTALVHVCDVFEALTAVRPYKRPRSPRDAYRVMLGDEGAFEPGAFAAFVSAVGFHPPGTRVELRGGVRGVVVRAGDHPARPVVRLTHDASGASLREEDRRVIDLGADVGTDIDEDGAYADLRDGPVADLGPEDGGDADPGETDVAATLSHVLDAADVMGDAAGGCATGAGGCA